MWAGCKKSQQLNLDVRIFLKGHILREREREHRWGCSNIHTQNPKEADFGHTGHSTLTVLAAKACFRVGKMLPADFNFFSCLSSMDDGLLLSRFQKRFFSFHSFGWVDIWFYFFELRWSPSIQILTFQKNKNKNKNSSPCHVNYGFVWVRVRLPIVEHWKVWSNNPLLVHMKAEHRAFYAFTNVQSRAYDETSSHSNIMFINFWDAY